MPNPWDNDPIVSPAPQASGATPWAADPSAEYTTTGESTNQHDNPPPGYRYDPERGTFVRDVVGQDRVTQGGPIDTAPQKPQFDLGNFDLGDVAQSAGSGLLRGIVGSGNTAGLGNPADVIQTIAEATSSHIPAAASDLMDALRDPVRHFGLDHAPTTTYGEYAKTAGEFLPYAAVGGPEAIIPTVMSALGSESAGQGARALGVDEAIPRLLGGVAGGLAHPENPLTAERPYRAGVDTRPPPTPGSMAAKVDTFQRSNVRPTMAAVGGEGIANITQAAASNAFSGGGARRNLAASIEDTGSEARRIAEAYGTPRAPLQTGETVRAGARRFALDKDAPDSFGARSAQQYEEAFADIPNAPVQTTYTDNVLQEILGRVSAPRLAEVLKNPKAREIYDALVADRNHVTFDDLRALRTTVRGWRGNATLAQDIPKAELARIEGALTEDIASNASRLGGPRAAAALRRADQFYGAGRRRIDGALEGFAGPNVTGEQAYDRIISAASASRGGDLRQLSALKRSLRPEEWGDVSSTVVSRLGNPTPGAADQSFSISTFLTNYNKLSPQGRAVLFGPVGGGGSRASALQADLDRLSEVAAMQKRVESARNSSNTAVQQQQLGTLGAMSGATAATALGQPAVGAGLVFGELARLGALRVTGDMLTDPRTVKALANLFSAKTPAAYQARLAIIRRQAQSFPAMGALYAQLQSPGEQGDHTGRDPTTH